MISSIPNVQVCGHGTSLWGQVLRSVLGRATKGQHPRGSGGYFFPWIPWRLIEAQGGFLTGHMSSHMANKDPGDTAGYRYVSMVFCSDSLVLTEPEYLLFSVTLAFGRDCSLTGCPYSVSVSCFLRVPCCLVLCYLFGLQTRRMIKTRRHQKGSLVAVVYNDLWWPGLSLVLQNRAGFLVLGSAGC